MKQRGKASYSGLPSRPSHLERPHWQLLVCTPLQEPFLTYRLTDALAPYADFPEAAAERQGLIEKARGRKPKAA